MFNSTYATVIEMVADIQNNQENNIKLDTSITNIEVGNYIKALGFLQILYLIFDYPHKHYTFKHFEI